MKNKLFLMMVASFSIALSSCGFMTRNDDGVSSTSSQGTSASHTHTYRTNVVEPTCEEKGYTYHYCECGDAYVDEWQEPLGHSFGNDGYCYKCGLDKYDEELYTTLSLDTCFTYELNEDGESYAIVKKVGACPAFIVLPSTHKDKPITRIGYEAFANDEDIVGLRIPDGYTIIEGVAFDCCSKLREIYIPDSVEKIGLGAFRYCESLVIYLESQEEKPGFDGYALDDYDIGMAASGWNNSSRPVIYGHISHGKTKDGFIYGIGQKNNSQYLTITGYIGHDLKPIIPNRIEGVIVNEISNSAFSGKGIVSISIPETVTSIGRNCFENCDELKRVSWPLNVETIPDYCFFSCNKLEYFVIPPTVKTIGENAFVDAGLHYIYVPSTVTNFKETSFNGLGLLYYVLLSSDKTVDYDAFSEEKFIFGVTDYYEDNDCKLHVKTSKGWKTYPKREYIDE